MEKKNWFNKEVEEIEKDGFCSYYDKYHKDEDDSKEEDSFKRTYPANISKSLAEEIEKTSKKAYKALALSGVAKIDYIYDQKEKKLYINEINTIPNFFSHHLFDDKNIDYRELLGIMIKEAIDKVNKKDTMIKTINDKMFKNVTSKDIRNMK